MGGVKGEKFLGGFTKKRYIEGNCLKREGRLGQFADLGRGD